MLKHKFLYSCLLISVALALLSTYFFYSVRNMQLPNTPENALSLKNYNLSRIEYNQEGNPGSTLKATEALEYQNSERAFIKKPIYTTITDDKKQWHITAERALILTHGKKILLEKNVTLRQPASKHTGESTLTTEKLTIYPKKHIAKSDTHTHIKRQNASISASGFVADLKKNTVTLNANSHGSYEETIK